MPLSDEDLEKARRIAAEVVDCLGAKYLPVFDCLNEEKKRREATARDLEKALSSIETRRPRRRKARKSAPKKDEQFS